ncbi:hypothetical protein J6590_058730 [Homalodisca vitripennis]|nr:hypothetical protein J6590_058730 [Homalodisca vitripennis]
MSRKNKTNVFGKQISTLQYCLVLSNQVVLPCPKPICFGLSPWALAEFRCGLEGLPRLTLSRHRLPERVSLMNAVKGRRGPSDRTEALVPGQHRPIAGIGIAPDNQAVNFTATHGNARQRAATLSGTRGMALISYSAAFRAYPLTKGQA